MTLREYLLKTGITTQEFAQQIQASHSSVAKWRISNRKIPRPDMIKRIARATRNQVSLRDWYKEDA